MAKRKVYVKHREFLPEVARITGISIITLEYEFGKSEILGQDACIIELELTAEQAAEIDRTAKGRKG